MIFDESFDTKRSVKLDHEVDLKSNQLVCLHDTLVKCHYTFGQYLLQIVGRFQFMNKQIALNLCLRATLAYLAQIHRRQG